MKDVVELVRSLGGIATVGERIPTYRYKGEKRTGRKAYRVNVRTPMNPFSLTRKARRWKEPNLTRGIESIEPAGKQKTICISVNTKRNLFITDHYIVTHNTIQALGVINAQPDCKRVLILCPASLRINWAREAKKWLIRDWTIQIIEERKGTLRNSDERLMVIVNYDRLGGPRGKAVREAMHKIEWDILIADEIHACKNANTQRAKAVLGKWHKQDGLQEPGLVHAAKQLVFLSGTPITNRPVELFPLARALDPDGLGSSFFRFVMRYCDAHRGQWGWDFTGASNLPELQDVLRERIMVRRLKIDVLKELPAKRRQIIELAPNGAAKVVKTQAEAYLKHEAAIDALEEVLEFADVMGDQDSFREAARQLSDAKQIAFEEMAKERHSVAVSKVGHVSEHIKSLLEQTSSKILVFAHHKDVVKGIELNLEQAGHKFVTITGSTNLQKRQDNVDTFQNDPAVRVFIGNIQAAGVGITLTAADTVVFAELDWVPANVLQAEDRCHRIGQKNPVLIQYLVFDGSVDSKMAHTLVSKMEVIESALDKEVDVEQLKAVEPRRRRAYPAATEEARQAAAAAIQRLAELCDGSRAKDGMGFNKLDTRFGKELAVRSMQRDLTDGEVFVVKKIARKYHSQLDNHVLATLWMADEAIGMDFL